MKYVIGTNNCKPTVNFIKESIPLVTKGDTIFSVGVTTADDVVAEFCRDEDIYFEATIQPDYGLRGNGADIYVFKKLAVKSDSAFIFYKKKDRIVSEMIEVLKDLDLEFYEFQIEGGQ